MNYYDDAGFPYPQSDRWKTPYGVKGAKRFVAQEGRGLISAPDRRRQQLGEEQARRDYQGLLERDMIGIEPYALWGGRATQDPDVGFQLAPMDFVPAGAGAKALGLLSSIPVGMIGALGYHGGRKWAPEAGARLGRPRLDKIGTGEGAQAYGHGFYVAESPGVGRSYQAALPPEYFYGGKKIDYIPEGLPADSSRQQTLAYFAHRSRQDLNDTAYELNSAAGFIDDALEAGPRFDATATDNYSEPVQEMLIDVLADLGTPAGRARARESSNFVNDASNFYIRNKAAFGERGVGSFYKMDVPDADVAKMLDYDAPLSEQPGILKTLRGISTDPLRSTGLDRQVQGMLDTKTGRDVLEHIQRVIYRGYEGAKNKRFVPGAHAWGKAREEASAYLAKHGIPGLRYLDRSSRTAGAGTRNMVLWDDDLLKRIKVLERE